MKTECFLDTNILIYAAAGKQDEFEKHAISRDLVLSTWFGVSAQSLGEFYAITRRKFLVSLSLVEVEGWIDELSAHPFVDVDEGIVRQAIFYSQRFKIKYFDAALLAAAERLSAPVFYTEDLNHGQAYGSVTAINPFLEH